MVQGRWLALHMTHTVTSSRKPAPLSAPLATRRMVRTCIHTQSSSLQRGDEGLRDSNRTAAYFPASQRDAGAVGTRWPHHHLFFALVRAHYRIGAVRAGTNSTTTPTCARAYVITRRPGSQPSASVPPRMLVIAQGGKEAGIGTGQGVGVCFEEEDSLGRSRWALEMVVKIVLLRSTTRPVPT
jgi:hypothetical protein